MTVVSTEPAISLHEGRFARLEAIDWWDQKKLAASKVLVAGAGALGNEVIKNLALLGVGQVVVIDMDQIELSNLSRSVLFRADDEGAFKANVAARQAAHIYPEIKIKPIVGNLLGDVGLGYYHWADVVIGALDNREARVCINSSCAQVQKPWIDGGIEVLNGIVRGFHAPEHACYECTMSNTDWDLLNKRRSCSLLARRAIQNEGTPTTPTTASVIGGIQVQEAVKILHGKTDFIGKGFFFEGAFHSSYPIQYAINPACEWHEDAIPIESIQSLDSSSTISDLLVVAVDLLGGFLSAIDFSREIITHMICPSCQDSREVFRPQVCVIESDAWCDTCQTERTPEFLHSITRDSDLIDKTLCEFGLPARDVVWARYQDRMIGIEIAGDPIF